MADHPLTDEICKSIAVCYPYNNRIDIEDCGHLTDMRAAADWQLEQVVEWLKDELDYDPNLLLDLKEAMRPQRQEKTDNTVQDTELIQRAMRYWENN